MSEAGDAGYGGRIVSMADQIARNFAVLGEAEAARRTAEHIRLFWDPRMRRELAHCSSASLSPIAAAARAILADEPHSEGRRDGATEM